MSGRLLSEMGKHCTKPCFFFFFVSGGEVFISTFSGSFDKSISRRLVSGCQEPRTAQFSALHDSLGPFNICCVLVSKLVWIRFVAGHVLASSLLEASILLQSLLPLLGFGVLVVLAILPS